MSEAIQALYTGDIARARALLGPDEELAVFEAAAFGRTARLRDLLAADATLANALSADGFSSLHLAIFGEARDAAEILIAAGADVNRCSRAAIAEVPPLGTAAFVRSTALARLLLDAGADVNGRARGGFTALHTAAQNDDLELAEVLLARGADPHAQTDDGRSPIEMTGSNELRAALAAARA